MPLPRPDGLPADARPFAGVWLTRELGRGGMGAVYEAVEPSTGRRVAVKVVRPDRTLSEKAKARFRREIEAMAALSSHPNIVGIHRAGVENGCPYLVMEYVNGRELTDRVLGLTDQEAARILIQICRAVGHAHERGFVHRDLKPQNILIDDRGRALLTDFGLVRAVEGESGLTKTGAVIGTSYYLSPEQAKGDIHRTSPATDVYALGAVLYHCLAKVPPHHEAKGMAALLVAIDDGSLTPLQELAPGSSPDLIQICEKAMAVRQEARYPDGNAMARDLERYLKGRETEARQSSREEEAATRKKKTAAIVAGSLVLLIGLIALFQPDPESTGKSADVTETDETNSSENETTANEGKGNAVDAQQEDEKPEVRLGWFGEPMPDGMRRGELSGNYIWEPDGAKMRYVPGGEFLMGDDEIGAEDERPVHLVRMSPFYIDTYEVTVRRFERFVEATGYQINAELAEWEEVLAQPGHPGVENLSWRNPGFDQTPRHPVAFISWYDARAYCRWAKKKLPTEAQWEYAATGRRDTAFPWGDEGFNYTELANTNAEDGFPKNAPVGSFNSRTWCGLYDMAGNVAEMCRDAYDPEAYKKRSPPVRDPVVDDPEARQGVMRGGHCRFGMAQMRCARRQQFLRIGAFDHIGFRTVVPAKKK